MEKVAEQFFKLLIKEQTNFVSSYILLVSNHILTTHSHTR